MFISLIGTWIQTVAQSWLVFQLTKSSFLLGFVGFLSSFPVFLFSLVGGVAADRINKRKILICTQIAFMLLAFLLAILTHLKLVTPLQVMIIATLNGLTMAFDGPSRQAMVVELVGKKYLTNAIALNSVAFNASRIIGPAIAAMFVASIGLSGCFYINGVSFVAVIVALFLIKTNSHHDASDRRSAFESLRDGLVFIKKNPLILTLIGVVGISSLFGVSYIILMPAFVQEVLHGGVKGMGILMSGSGVGAVIGALFLAKFGDKRGKGKLLIGSALLFSFSLMMLAFSKSFMFAFMMLMVVGAASVTAMALVNTLLQIMVEDRFRGRVMSVFMLTFSGMIPFGNLLSGAVAQGLGVSFAVFLNGLVCSACFVIVLLFSREVRELA